MDKQTDGYRRALPLYQLNSALRRRLQIVRRGVRDRSFSRRLRTIQFKHFGHFVFIGCKELLVGLYTQWPSSKGAHEELLSPQGLHANEQHHV